MIAKELERTQLKFDIPDSDETQPPTSAKPNFIVTDMESCSAGFNSYMDASKYRGHMRLIGSPRTLFIVPADIKLPHNHTTSRYPSQDGKGIIIYSYLDGSTKLVEFANQLPLLKDNDGRQT